MRFDAESDLSALIAEALGDRVRVGVSPLSFSASDLLAEERPLVEKAVEKRQREFATGRVLARRLLAELGFSEQPLLAETDRAPIWPEGAVGSISHTRDLCVVVVSKKTDAISLGVDVEVRKPLKDELRRMILRPLELDRLSVLPEPQRGERATLAFSAKECAYKCQYPLTRVILEFHEVELDFFPHQKGGESGRFVAHVLRPGLERELEGAYWFTERVIVSAMILPRTSQR